MEKKKKLSQVITVKLFWAVFAAFIVSSVITYVLLSHSAVQSAHSLLRSAGTDVYIDVKTKAQTPLLITYMSTLQYYFESGDEAKAGINEFLKENEYTYFAHADGTIYLSGNEKFLGKNVKEIEEIGYIMDAISFDIANDSTFDDSTTFADLCYYPVKTLDGEHDTYYLILAIKSHPDEFFIVSYPPEAFKTLFQSEGSTIAGKRRVGLTGRTVIIDNEHTIISDFDEVHNYEPFPDAELLNEYISGNDIETETVPVNYSKYIKVNVDIQYKSGVGTFWGEKYFYYLSDIEGALYYICLYPYSEAMSQPYRTIIFIVIIEIIVFSVLFIVLNRLIKRRVVKKLDTVNASLEKITNGDLNERVEVRDTREFDTLSTDINTTVDRLKEYIAEAAARIDADLAVAKAIQTSALPNVFPPFPEHKEFELFASMTAAKEVGGDFYDFYMLNSSTLGFLIADVSGKSIPGAMFMMTAKTIIKSLAESGLPPADVFTQANEKLCEGNDAEMFVTAWLGYLDLKTGVVRVANAGHNPPVLIRGGKAEYIVLKPGLMLAGMDGVHYKEQTVPLQKGDILYLYTDGVTEAMNKTEDLYGEERLQKTLSFGERYPEPTAENGTVGAVCKLVGSDLAAFTSGAEQSDDITMLCIEYLG